MGSSSLVYRRTGGVVGATTSTSARSVVLVHVMFLWGILLLVVGHNGGHTAAAPSYFVDSFSTFTSGVSSSWRTVIRSGATAARTRPKGEEQSCAPPTLLSRHTTHSTTGGININRRTSTTGTTLFMTTTGAGTGTGTGADTDTDTGETNNAELNVDVDAEVTLAVATGDALDVPVDIPVDIPVGEPVVEPVGEPVGVPVGEPVGVPVGELVRVLVGEAFDAKKHIEDENETAFGTFATTTTTTPTIANHMNNLNRNRNTKSDDRMPTAPQISFRKFISMQVGSGKRSKKNGNRNTTNKEEEGNHDKTQGVGSLSGRGGEESPVSYYACAVHKHALNAVQWHALCRMVLLYYTN
jgi:hypothetical protein